MLIKKEYNNLGKHTLEENMPCWIQQTKRGEAATASCPQVQPAARAKDIFLLETCTQSTRMHYLYTLLDIQITDRHTEHSHQHQTRVHSVL